MSDQMDIKRMCRHCGAVDAVKLGQCSVCAMAVCDRCGNVQYSHGERRITHNRCLADDDAGFKMIKFVR